MGPAQRSARPLGLQPHVRHRFAGHAAADRGVPISSLLRPYAESSPSRPCATLSDVSQWLSTRRKQLVERYADEAWLHSFCLIALSITFGWKGCFAPVYYATGGTGLRLELSCSFQILADGWLTCRPIVTYAPAQFSGLRLGCSPLTVVPRRGHAARRLALRLRHDHARVDVVALVG
jgi:hypothetical protein